MMVTAASRSIVEDWHLATQHVVESCIENVQQAERMFEIAKERLAEAIEHEAEAKAALDSLAEPREVAS